MISPGDIVLFRYPYSDYSSSKRRPCLVIAERPDFPGEFLVVFLTSQTSNCSPSWDILLDPQSDRDQSTRLKQPTLIKTTKLLVVSDSQFSGVLGQIHPDILRQARGKLRDWLQEPEVSS